MRDKIRVLVVDDSAVVRQALKSVLSSDPGIVVIATASDPYFAVKKMKKEMPDVITLDIKMPRMDGLTFLKKLMKQHPLPVVVCSSITADGSDTALRALEYGAVEIIQKPKMGAKRFIEESKILVCDAVKAASKARIKKVDKEVLSAIPPKLTADAVLPKPARKPLAVTTAKVVVVGASTGGTEAISTLLLAMPLNAPGIVIVQHMPEHFTSSFAARLDTICQVSVKEAEDGDAILVGHALIAPGNKHTLIKRNGSKYLVEVKEGPLVCRHRPSVDVLFRSAARYAGANAVGAILTGMGDDGARGMLEMKEAGAYNIAQDDATCIVFGMPNEAIKRGAVDKVLSIEAIAPELVRQCNSRGRPDSMPASGINGKKQISLGN